MLKKNSPFHGKNLLLISFFLFSGFFYQIKATLPLSLNHNQGRYPLGHYLEILEDRSGKMTLEQVSSPETKGLFVQSRVGIPNFGFSDSAFWIRFTVRNPEKYTRDYYLEYSQPLTDTLSLYYTDEAGRLALKIAGDHIYFDKRDINFHNFIFKIPVHAGLNTYYLRVETTSSVYMDMHLFNHKSLLEMMTLENGWLGFYYGLMAVMFLYNLFIFITIRETNYFYYTIHIFSFIVFQFTLNGLSFQYLWQNSVWWANDSPAIFLGLISLTGLFFTRDFLRTWKNSPFWDIVLKIMAIPIIISIVISLFSYKYGIRMGTIVGTLLLISMLIAGFACLEKGDRAARFYVIAWSLFLIGSILKALQSNGLVPTNFVTIWGQQIGSAIDVTLLSLALMDRFNIIKMENEKLIDIQKKHSESLKHTVEERTQELLSERNKLKTANKIMQYELSLARKIQQKLIPSELPNENIAVLYKPMIQVGGDFYDIFTFDGSRKTGIFMSDVAGHGVQAAFITSMIKTMILQQSTNKLQNPALLLSHINQFLLNQKIQGFVTIYYGIFDEDDNTLTFCNAGHPAPYLITDKVKELKGYRTLPAGIAGKEKLEKIGRTYQSKTITIPKNSKILFYTDGLTECTPTTDRLKNFEHSIMTEVLLSYRNDPCQAFLNQLYGKLLEFRGSDEFADDVCAVCLDVN